jgi:tetratricopeptide (TPR) repeat protein
MSDQLQKAQELIEADHLDEAEAILCAHLEREPNSAQSLHGLGIIEFRRRNLLQAQAWWERAIALNPHSSVMHSNLGVTLSQVGENERALTHLRKAIRLKPDYASALYHLSSLHRFKPDDPLIRVIEELLAKGDLSRVDRCHLHFAAGKAYDDIGLRRYR